MLNFFCYVMLIVIPVGVVTGTLMALYHKLTSKSRRIRHTLENHVSIEELFVSLEFVLQTEINLYESYLQNKTDIDLTTLQNSEFINIYKDLSMKCLKAPSPQFWELAEVYMSRESIQTYITQRVYDYLAEKVKE